MFGPMLMPMPNDSIDEKHGFGYYIHLDNGWKLISGDLPGGINFASFDKAETTFVTLNIPPAPSIKYGVFHIEGGGKMFAHLRDIIKHKYQNGTRFLVAPNNFLAAEESNELQTMLAKGA